MQKQTKQKAKRVLTELTFEHEGAAVALVGPSVGGPANGIPVLTFKASKFTDEHITKASKIKVTMEIQDFLQKFYGLYSDDAEVLARALGFNTEREAATPESYEDYITSKVQSIEVIKSLYEAEKLSDVLCSLDPDEYLVMLEDQLTLEKAFRKIDKQTKEQLADKPAETESELVVKATETDTSHVVHEVSEVKSSVITNKSKEILMTKQVEDSTEMVEKSLMVNLQKALDDQAVELQKALDIIAVHQKEKQEQIQKSKTAQFVAVIKDEKLQAPIVKAALSLESDDDFGAFLAAITAMSNAVETSQEFMEKSALFKEQGASVSDETPQKESAVARILKAKQVK